MCCASFTYRPILISSSLFTVLGYLSLKPYKISLRPPIQYCYSSSFVHSISFASWLWDPYCFLSVPCLWVFVLSPYFDPHFLNWFHQLFFSYYVHFCWYGPLRSAFTVMCMPECFTYFCSQWFDFLLFLFSWFLFFFLFSIPSSSHFLFSIFVHFIYFFLMQMLYAEFLYSFNFFLRIMTYFSLFVFDRLLISLLLWRYLVYRSPYAIWAI